MINNYDSVVACPYTVTPHSQKQESTSYTATKRNWLSFVTVFVALFSFVFVQGQTTLISPTGGGGFENGSTFAANGWTTVNPATDAWSIGNVPVSASGTNCAYVSANGGTSWTYSQTSVFNHVYRDVTIPAGETKVVLSFKWKVGGEGTTTSDWDNMKVFIAPTTLTPLATTAVTGAIQLSGSTATSAMYKLSSTNWNTETITFSASPGTYRLIFSWKSDTSTISNPPAAIDDISMTSAQPDVYTWNAISGSASWATAASWTPARTTPNPSDILNFSNGGSSTVTSIPTQTVGNIVFSNNTTANFQAAATSTLTMGSLTIPSGSTLLSNGTTAALSMAFPAGATATNTIGGRLEISNTSTTANVITFANSVTTVSGTLAAGGTLTTAAITGTTATLLINGTYEHKYTTTAGTIPTATWGNSSNCNVSSYTTNSNATGGFAQNFANFTWNCPAQTGNINFSASGTIGVRGTMAITSTGTGTLRLTGTGAYTFNVNNFTQTGGTFDLASGNSGATATFNVSGTFNQSGGTFLSSGTVTSNPTLHFNGTAAQTATFTGQPTGPITYRFSNPAGVTLNTNFATFALGNGTLGGLRISTNATAPIVFGTTVTGFAYNAANSTLTYDATNLSTTARAQEFPSASGPTSLRVDVGANGLLVLPFARTISNTLTMASGDIDISSNSLTLGTTATAPGTLTYTAGNIRVTTGSFTRWYGTASLPTTVSTGVGFYPIANGTNNRNVSLYFSAATITTGGSITVSHTSLGGISAVSPTFVDGTVTIGERTNSYWSFASNTIALGTTTLGVRVTGGGAFTATTAADIRFIQSAGSVGTSANVGGTSPNLQAGRTGLSLTNLTGDNHYIGSTAANMQTIFNSVATGDWNSASTWDANAVPGANDIVNIMPGHTVTVNSASNNARSIAIGNGGATLTIASGDLTVATTVANSGTINANGGTLTITGASTTGITNAAASIFNVSGGNVNLGVTDNTFCNRTFTNNGTLSVSSGILNVFGNITSASGSTFNQSGGAINIDGNAGGNATNSVASATAILQFNQLNSGINLTGGTLTIVDPHANTTASLSIGYNNGTAGFQTSTAGHTLRFGNGVSTDAGGNAVGFQSNLWIGTAFMSFGNIIVNSGTGTNRSVTCINQLAAIGDVTVTSGSTLNLTSSLVAAGNVSVNSGGTFINLGGVAAALIASNTSTTLTFGPSTSAQTIGGSGTYQNLATSPTANLTNLNINNTNATGVTLSVPLSVSGTLTMTSGLINTTSTNLLTLGTSSAAGTLVGTPSATNMIVGPFARTFATRTAAGTYDNTTLYPVGKGTAYTPVFVDPSIAAASVATIRGEAFATNSGSGSIDVTNLSASRWEVLTTNGFANLTNANVRVSESGILSSYALVQAPTAAGVYDRLFSGTSAFAAGPILTGSGISATALTNAGYFAYGTLAAIQPPTITDFTPLVLCANGGPVVTITGTNLGTVTSVLFNSISGVDLPGTITAKTATTVTVIAPSGVVAGVIKVINPAGNIDSSVSFTVVLPPTITASAGTLTICSGTSTTLTGSGGATYSWSPATGLSATTGTTVTASPTVNTTYTVTGVSAEGCSSTGTVLVTVSPAPSAITIAPPAAICSGGTATITATGGTYSQTILSENFNAATNSWTTLNTSAGGLIANAAWTLRSNGYTYATTPATFTSNDASQFYLSNSDEQGASGTSTNTALISPSFATTNYAAATVSFWHYFRQAGTAKIQYTIDGGTNWVDIQSYTTTQGAPTAFVQANLTLPAAALNKSAVQIRFKYDAVWQYFWAIDNVTISGTGSSIIWSPTTDLYTDAAATTAYTGTAAAVVYAKLTAPATYTATSTLGSCSVSTPVTVTPNALPTITLDATTPVCNGGTSSSLSYTATTVTPTQYTIDFNAAAELAGFADISTFTAFTTSPISLVVPAGAAPGTYTGTITVKNANGCISATPQTFTVVINTPVAITTQPSNSVSLENGNASFTVAASGSGLTYQWQESTDNGVTWNNISGATSATYTAVSVTNAMNGYLYKCIVSGATPCTSVTSSVVSLTISTTAIATQPLSTTICSNETATFTIATTGTTPTYQWQISTNSGTSWSDIAGETTTTLTVSGLTAATTQRYRCVLSGLINSDAAILTVNDIVAITTQPADVTVCSNTANATFTTVATGTGLTYQWQQRANSSGTWANVGTGTTGGTTATLTVTPIALALDGYQYQCIVTGTAPCAGQTTTTATLSVTGYTLANSTTNNKICVGGSVTFTATPTTSSPALTYSWVCATAGSGATTPVTGSVATITPTQAGSYTYTLTATGGTCSFTSTQTIVVDVLPVITTATANPNVACVGSTINLGASIVDIAPSIVTLGAGSLAISAAGRSFFPGAWGGAKTQYLIKASELTALGLVAGNITSVAFQPTTAGQTYTGFQLWVNQTTNTAMTTTFLPNGTQVYLATGTNNGYLPVANTVNTLNFGTGAGSSSALTWDGVSNLVLTFSWSSVPSATTATGTTMLGDLLDYTCTAYDQSDNLAPADELALVTADGTGTRRPIFLFNGVKATDYTSAHTWSWSDGTSNVLSTATGSVVVPSATTTYTVTATNIATGCSASQNVVVTANPLPTAPSVTASTQCGLAVPTASVADPNTFTTPTFKWYSAATGGTMLQSSPSTTYTTAISATTTFYVSVINPTTGCESARTPVTVTVTAPDPIAATANASICLGDSVTLTAANTATTPAQTYTYSWLSTTPNSGITTAQTGASISVTPDTVGSYTYTATANGGGCQTTATVTVTVNALPNINSATASAAIACGGSAINLAATASDVNPGTATLGAGAITPVAYSYDGIFEHYFGGNKTQFLVTAAELTALGVTAGNITSLGIVMATVTPQAYAGFAVSVASTADANMSLGINSTATFSPVFSSAAYTPTTGVNTFNFSTPYDWDGSSNLIVQFCWSNNNGGFGTSNYALVDTQSYVSTAYYRADSLTPSAICGGGSASGTTLRRPKFVFGAQIDTNTTANYAWTWSNGSTTVLTAATGSVILPASGTTNYTATATNATTGCASSSLPITVTANPVPTAPTATNSVQCGTLVPTASVSNTNTFASAAIYNWYASATSTTPLQSSTSATFTSLVNTTTTFHVAVANPTTGCESARVPVTVSVNVPDLLSASANDTSICIGQSVTISTVNLASTPTQNYTYSWASTTGSGLTAGQTAASFTVTPTTDGSYTYTVTGVDGSCQTTASVTVVVIALPVVTLDVPSTILACAGSTINLGASVNAISAGTTAPSGTGTGYTSFDGYPTFFGSYWYEDWSQMVYTASELQAMGLSPGDITSITFNIGALPDPATINGYSIRLGATANNTLSAFQTTGLTTVYGPVNYTASATGNVTINFTTPYNWDGSSNIIVDVRGTGQFGNANATTQFTTTTGNTVLFANTTFTPNPNLWTSSPTATTSTSRPNVRFGGQVSTNENANYAWTWSDGTSNVLTAASGTVTLPASSVTYTATATHLVSGCSNLANSAQVVATVVSTTAPTGVVTNAPSSICFGDAVSLSLNYTGSTQGLVFQWESSIDNGVSWQDIASATGTTATATPTVPTRYRCEMISCGGTPGYSSVANVSFTNAITSTTPATRCGTGTATINAVANAGADVNWYDSATGGLSIGVGSSFTTPIISATTTYYATAETVVTGTKTLGAGATNSSSTAASFFPGAWGGTKTQYIIKASELTAAGISAGPITSLGFEPTNSGQTYQGFNVSLGGTSATSAPTTTFIPNTGLSLVYKGTETDDGYTPVANTVNNLTFGTGAGTASNFDWDGSSNVVVSISWSRVPSATTATSTTMKVDNVGFVSSAYRQRDSFTPTAMADETSVSGTSNNRPRFTINGQVICASPRVAVPVTVNPSPDLTLSSSSATICSGSATVPVTVTSTLADFDTYTWSPSTGVSGNSITGWIFNPTSTTTYTLTASQSAGGLCSNTLTYVVNTNPLPSVMTIAPATPSVCVDSVQALTVSGGTLGSNGIGQVGTATTLTGATSQPTAFCNRFDHYWVQMVYTAAELTAAGVQAGNITALRFTTGAQGSANNVTDFKVRLGNTSNNTLTGFTTSGLTQVFSAATYATMVGVNTITFDTPYVWDGTSNIIVDMRQTGIDATNNTTTEYTPTTGNNTVVYAITSTANAGGSDGFATSAPFTTTSVNRLNTTFVWNSSVPTTITWSPVTNLYTNAAATTPYTGGTNATTVYVKSASAANTTYTATATAEVTGCATTATVSVVVNPLPTVVTVNQAVCSPSTVDLTAAAVTTGSATGLTFTYWTNVGATTALTNPNAVATSGTYYIKGTNANGCSVVTPVTVTINPLPVLTITNPATVCSPATVNITASAVTTGSDSGLTLTYWSDSTATTALTTASAVTTSGTYYIKAVNANGCVKIMPVTVTINVTSAPTGAATQTFCGSANITQLVATGSGVKWYDAATGGNLLPNITAIGLTTGTTYYATQTVNGCESTTRFAVTAVINAIPTAPNAAAQDFCSAPTVAQLLPNGSTINWYSASTAGSPLASSTVLSATTYYVSQTINGCESARTAVSITITPIAAPTGAASQTIFGGVAADATIEDISVSGTNVIWYPTPGDAAAGTNAIAAGTQLVDGQTYYAVSVVGTCRSAALAVTVVVVLDNQNFDLKALRYYPNPVIDVLTISYTNEITAVQVYDISGRIVRDMKPNSNEVTVDLSDLAASVYVVKVFADTTSGEFKVVKK